MQILEEEVEASLKEAAVISMGTEISPQDLANIIMLCDQVISLSEYRAQLFDYLRSRMNAIAPNLTVLVGELVGARLIAHAGSLIQLAKQPASTVQILGAEKVGWSLWCGFCVVQLTRRFWGVECRVFCREAAGDAEQVGWRWRKYLESSAWK
jgi:hypothetical protein